MKSSTFSKWDDNSDSFWKKENNSGEVDVMLTSKSTGFSDRYAKIDDFCIESARMLIEFESWSE